MCSWPLRGQGQVPLLPEDLISKWGSTKFHADEFETVVAEKRLLPDGCRVKYTPNRGPLDKGPCTHEGAVPSFLLPTNNSYFPVKK